MGASRSRRREPLDGECTAVLGQPPQGRQARHGVQHRRRPGGIDPRQPQDRVARHDPNAQLAPSLVEDRRQAADARRPGFRWRPLVEAAGEQEPQRLAEEGEVDFVPQSGGAERQAHRQLSSVPALPAQEDHHLLDTQHAVVRLRLHDTLQARLRAGFQVSQFHPFPGRDHLLLRFTDIIAAAEPVAKQVSRQKEGTHADEIETSMMLYIDPDSVDMRKATKDFPQGAGPLTPDPGRPGSYSPSGIYGDATLATRDKGRKVVEATVQAILKDIEEIRRAPLP